MINEGDLLHTVTADNIPDSQKRLGEVLVWTTGLLFLGLAVWQMMFESEKVAMGFETWRPVLYAYMLWATALCVAQVMVNGEKGKRTLFVLPAALFVISLVIFPLLFALYISFTDWNLASANGPQPNGWDNIREMWSDQFYWNALKNMVYYVLAVSVEYVIAFGLALLLNAQIRARKFFRVVFLLPLMLSPVAVSWMVGKSMLEVRFGPISRIVRELGFEPSFFGNAEIARFMIMAMDAWTFIPFIMIMLLAGLQALPREIIEASKVDGASGWQSFTEVIFPLMLPVSVTAIVIRIIFKLKLADIIINVTSGGPGGATDSVTSFIFREYRDRSNVGYGTLLAIIYLVLIILFITIFLKFVSRWMERPA
ncbi:MAG: sugar ABC transporter permease [Tateyamaria sp.]|jgi:multiple sugar transport system permease protein|nr:sugar ABC transporter permease [Tateyamaria sp.]MBT5302842.1 sugar ABC transporter permease [Tateyamaria sp.]MBT6267174.1 sugar ABC transporter permease [Tateyamaria sp.]MBT6343230.1 sugar ABC transporter permease [Tateyamaria sp.]MBT7447840.1 sugar ABC transporter permease [Tateyamaria sp.]